MHVGDSVHVLRPSLYAMSLIGSPAMIVETYAQIMADVTAPALQWGQFKIALGVIHCCSEDDLSDVFGYFNEKGKYVRRLASMNDVLPIARCLMVHGVTGAQKPLPRRSDSDPEFVSEFVASDHVATAVAHLGMSEREAWSATMTSLVGALRSKFPATESTSPGAKAPSKEEHEATEAWFARIDEKRKKRTLH